MERTSDKPAGRKRPKSRFGEKFLMEQKQKLLREKKRLTGRDDEPSSEEPHMSDPLDMASSRQQWEVGLRVDTVSEEKLSQIDEALSRMRCGLYGICSECGRHIPKARLEAMVHAVRCVSCQNLYGNRRAKPSAPRNVEENTEFPADNTDGPDPEIRVMQ